VTAGVTAGLTGAAATLLVLLLAHNIGLRSAAIGYADAVPVGLLLGLTTAAAATAHAAIVLVVGVLGTAAALVDARERRLPNVLTATLGVGLLITLLATAFLTHNSESLPRALIAAGLTVLVTLMVKVVSPAAVGWGDVKLLPSLTAALAWVGLPILAQGLVLWMVLLLVTATVWRLGHFDPSDTVPYGPALVVGTLGALLVT
jgi:leader peptidase (prepilin peptidase) / N-methyltransferase